MNEKIKELAIEICCQHQPSFDNIGLGNYTKSRYNKAIETMMEEFAELIIKECASICDRLEGEYLEKSKDEYECFSDLKADGAAWCSTEILNYFGTEL